LKFFSSSSGFSSFEFLIFSHFEKRGSRIEYRVEGNFRFLFCVSRKGKAAHRRKVDGGVGTRFSFRLRWTISMLWRNFNLCFCFFCVFSATLFLPFHRIPSIHPIPFKLSSPGAVCHSMCGLAAIGEAFAAVGAAFTSFFADETTAQRGETGTQASTILFFTDNNSLRLLLRITLWWVGHLRTLLVVATLTPLWRTVSLLRVLRPALVVSLVRHGDGVVCGEMKTIRKSGYG